MMAEILKNIKTRVIKPSFLFTVLAVLAILVILSAYIDYNQSSEELYALMEEQAHSLLEVALASSSNVLSAGESMEDELQKRVLDNAGFIKYLFESGRLNDESLNNLSRQKGLYRIFIYSSSGELLLGTHRGPGRMLGQLRMIEREIAPILAGEKDTVIIGLKGNRFAARSSYSAAISLNNGGAVVVRLEAAELGNLRQKGNFQELIKNITHNKNVIYFAVENEKEILVQSPDTIKLPSYTSEIISKSGTDSVFTRRLFIGETEILEALHPFYFNARYEGMLRIGLSLEPLANIKSAALNRAFINAAVLIFVGFILFSFIFVRQNYSLLRRQYTEVETYSSGIIQTVSDAIIVYDDADGIQIFNEGASALFGKKFKDVKGKPISCLFADNNIITGESGASRVSIDVNGKQKHLFISFSSYRDAENKEHRILAVKDLTEFQILQDQLKRKERLTAMGELASGVAHEIRNPLNAIGTIVQQLDKDFKPASSEEEYHSLAKLVQKEIKRINETITDFLRFSKPENIRPSLFYMQDLFEQIKKQYSGVLSQKDIIFEINNSVKDAVYWDENQILQALINLLQNAVDAVDSKGSIKISAAADKSKQDTIEIIVEDSGAGIPAGIQQKIFNLYFTTKARGTGIGLPLVQKIVDEHGGIIFFNSVKGKTAFVIQLPRRVII